MIPIEVTKVTKTAQQAETDHPTATDIQIQAAAAETDHTAETNTQETKHPPTTDHQEIHTNTGHIHKQTIIHEAPETDPCQETDTLTDHDPTPETGTIIEDNAAEHQTAKAQEGHNRPTKIKRLYQG